MAFRVLLVEDDDLDVLNIERVFRAEPAIESLDVTRDGVEALELLRKGEVDLYRLVLLVDLRMPRMSGLELMRELRLTPRLSRLPVVIFTTSRDEGDRKAAYSLHAAGYLLKPIDSVAFRECMRTFVDYWSHVEHPESRRAEW